VHELGIAMEIVDLATARANGAQVTRVVVEVGALTAVLPDALAFAWDCAIEETPLAQAKLEIITMPGRGRCRVCQAEQEMTMVFGRCGCSSTDLELVAGEELRIKELEVCDVRDMRMRG